MDTFNLLEHTLNEILRVINPLRQDIESRLQIIQDLRDAISTVESLRGATVEPFGSFLSQLFTRWGDLDISIELYNGSYIAVAARKHKQTLLGDVLKVLRRTGTFRRLKSVSHARVPILKLESKNQSISCDISINNISGKMKSKFLLWISIIDQRFRDMVLLVKEWAKAHEINDPKTGTLNSYSLSLLVIFHFQTCNPAILPPLQDLYSGNIADDLIGIKADVERRIEEVTFNNIAKFRNERRMNRSSLSELFTSFLAKFSDISTQATEYGVCTYTGRWEEITTTTRWLPKTYSIFIEDPFEQPENTARSVSSNQLNRISQAFAYTHNLTLTPNLPQYTLIPALVRYEISHFFPGFAYGNPMLNVGNHSMANRNAGTHSRTNQNTRHRQFQQTRHQNHPDNNNHAFQGQVLGNNQLPRSMPQIRHNRAAMPTSEGPSQNDMSSQRPDRATQQKPQQIWRPKNSDK